MPPYEFDPNAPIYLQIIDEIKKRSMRGVYSPGSKLPSVRDMAIEMDVNPNTMARAYAELEREGFVFTRRRKGSFVTEDEKKIEDMRQELAQRTVIRFVEACEELRLSDKQIDRLLTELERDKEFVFTRRVKDFLRQALAQGAATKFVEACEELNFSYKQIADLFFQIDLFLQIEELHNDND